jgi:hypothetical protein
MCIRTFNVKGSVGIMPDGVAQHADVLFRKADIAALQGG